MPAELVPIAYVETNWLVALAFPHDQWFGRANRVLLETKRGGCEIRLPFAARIEAPHRITRKSTELNKVVTEFKDALYTAIQNGETQLQPIFDAAGEDVLGKYVQRDAMRAIDQTIAAGNVKVLAFDHEHLEIMEKLRPRLKKVGGKDMADLAILASIVHDRRSHHDERPTILFSTDSRFFGEAVPSDLLQDSRIVYDQDFDLPTAVGRWKATFSLST
jgi:hypothetical protein